MPLQAEGPERRPVAGDVADRALDLGHAELSGHRRPPRSRSRDRRLAGGCRLDRA